MVDIGTVSAVAKKEGMRISKNRPIANSADFLLLLLNFGVNTLLT